MSKKTGGVANGYVDGFFVKSDEVATEGAKLQPKEVFRGAHMIVFSFVNPKNLFEVIDVFVEEPKPFSEMENRRQEITVFGIIIPILGIDDLIDLKKQAGRDKDMFDIKELNKIKRQKD